MRFLMQPQSCFYSNLNLSSYNRFEGAKTPNGCAHDEWQVSAVAAIGSNSAERRVVGREPPPEELSRGWRLCPASGKLLPFGNRPHLRRSVATCDFLKAATCSWI
jgi:hypothetical protein